MVGLRGRPRAGLVVGALTLTAVLGGAAEASAAPVPVRLDCEAFLTAPPHVPGSGILVDGDAVAPGRQPQTTNFTVEAPTIADAGTEVTITLPGGSTTFPSASSGFTINHFKNIATTYSVVGGTVVDGSANASGPPLIDGSPGTAAAPVYTPNSLKIGTESQVPGGGTLQSPTVTFKVVAGAAGTTVQIFQGGTTLTANLAIGAGLDATTICNPPPNRLVSDPNPVLASTTIVEPPPPPPPPPPPGAPTAANDGPVEVEQGKTATIDVLANDAPADASTPIDKASLKIKTTPSSGAAVVQDDKVVYTAAAGFVGRVSFQYEICSQAETPTTEDPEPPAPACHFANVTVDVTAAPTVAATTTTTSAAPTTVAPAADAELPRTGSTALGLTALGAASCVAGGVLAARSRKERFAR